MTRADTGPPATEPASMPARRITRSRDDRVIAGVCGGLGRYFGVDPLWFRGAFVVLLIGGGSGILLYLLAWLILPEDRAGDTPLTGEGSPRAQGPMLAGIALIAVGAMLLANTLLPWFDRVMWPLVVLAGGGALLYSGSRRERT